MKTLVFLVVLVALFLLLKRVMSGPSIGALAASAKVKACEAVLIDVREPGEWAGGVAEGALLLPLSDLRGARERWTAELGKNRDKELIVYCASGMRSGMAAGILRKEGYRAANAGGFSAWCSAGLPVKRPQDQEVPAGGNLR